LLDGDVENLDGNLKIGLFVGKGDSATRFPRPESIVLDFNFNEFGHTWSNLENIFRFTKANSSLLLPALFVPLLALATVLFLVGPLVFAPLHLLFESFRVIIFPVGPLAELSHEFLHHIATTATTTSMATSTAASSAASASSTTFMRMVSMSLRSIHES